MVIGRYTITKKAQEIPNVTIDKDTVKMTEKAPKITLENAPAEEGEVTYTSSNTSVITISEAGEITLVGAGTTEIKVTYGETENYSSTTSEGKTITVVRDNLEETDFTFTPNTTIYNGQQQGVEVTENEGIDKIGNITVSYNKVVSEEEKTPVEGTPVNAGTYEVVVNVTEGINYNEVRNMVIGRYTITKINPVLPIIEKLNAVYGKTLEDVELPIVENGTFSWNDKTLSVGNVGERTFTATYTPADTDNYNVIDDVEVTINVAKADPEVPAVGTLNAVYGQILENVQLPTVENGTFSWNDKTLSVGNAGTNTFEVTYTPVDTDNYNVIDDIEVVINVAKAEPEYTIPTLDAIVYNANTTLENIILPAGWTWIDNTIVPTVDVNEYAAKYTPNDTDNYNIVYTNIGLTVLEPADQTELDAYLAQIGYENLIPTDYTNYEGLASLVEEARNQEAQIYLDEILEEIKAYDLDAKPINKAILDNYMIQINQLVETDYNNWEELETKITEAYAVTDLQSNFDAKFEEVKYFRLSIKPLDKTELIEIERQLANLNKDDYTLASWEAVEGKITQAKKQKLQSKLDAVLDTIDLENDLVKKQVSSIEIVTLPSKTTYVYGETLDLRNGTLKVLYDNGTSETIEMTAEGVTSTNFAEVINTLGSHVLTISYEGKTAIYRIEVVDEITGIEIDVTNMKKDYLYGEELDLSNATVKPVMKSGTSTVETAITTDMISGYNKNSLGDGQIVTVSYLGYEESFTVNVDDYVISIEVTAPDKISYRETEELDLTGMLVTKVYASGNTKPISQLEVNVTGYDNTIVGTQKITVTYGEFTDSFNVVVRDTTKPTIMLNGEDEIILEVGTEYQELKATAFGDSDGLTEQIVITYVKVTDSGEVEVQDIDESVLATYKAKYNVADGSKAADEVIRTIKVVDTTKPEITLDANNIYEIALNGTIPEFSATATDNYDRNVTVQIDTTSINANQVGNYTVTFTATDSSLNKTVETVIFKVVDNEKPVITLKGQNPYIVEVNTIYEDLGVTVTDNSGDIEPKLNLNNLDMTKLGEYTVIYTAKDASGNEAIPVERTVKVVDITKPQFTSFKDGTRETVISIEKGTEYVDEGAIFTDNNDGEILVIGEGTVNYNRIGTYTITYKVVDSSNNPSDEIVRIVNVTDYPPVISYYDEYNAKVVLSENGEIDKVFDYYPVIFFNRGTAKLVKDGQEIQYVENTELTDGKYTITVKAEDGTSTTRTFIVDTKAPEVKGVGAGIYFEAVTIEFTDVSDIEKATLTNISTNEVINIKEWLADNNTNRYTISTSGTYTLQVEDKYKNAIMPITFMVEI